MIGLLALAAAAAAPQPGELKTFRDWTVGCDNGRACQAVALMPEDGNWDARVTMAVRRGAEPDAAPEIGFDGDVPVAGLSVGGKRLPVTVVQKDGFPAVRPESVPAMLEAIRTHSALETLDAAGKRTGMLSLAGASAALLYMDEQQRRLGTVTALVQKGSKPASAVPAPPPLPVVAAAPVPKGAKPLVIPSAEVRRLARETQCDEAQPEGKLPEIETAAIDGRTTLVLLSCGAGAYNFMSVPFLARREGKRLRISVAPLDHDRRSQGETHPMLVNAGWDEKKRRLGAFSKGRGIGDCGVGDEYAWDGTRFRLVEQIAMDECRGSVDYITTWRAMVR